MTNEQLYLAIGLPILMNLLTSAGLFLYVRGELLALRREMELRFVAVNQRFDDLRETWREALRRVEEILDARLKALEEHRP